MKADTSESTPYSSRRLYGRRKGPKLSARKTSLLETQLPLLRLAVPDDGRRLAPTSFFKNSIREVWLEIGFGAGEHLSALARGFPHVGFIGCEPYISGMAALLGLVNKQGLDNIRLSDIHGQDIIESLETASITRMFVLFPDPWPKTRHWRRRFVNPAMIKEATRVLVDGGWLYMASDEPSYVKWVMQHMTAPSPTLSANFEWRAESPADWRQRSDDWPKLPTGMSYPQTRYETKARQAGRCPTYLTFRRFPRN
ncbi:MAG: tRNA (guanine(46)-N(7))-methyltransferase TrmB [Parvularculales bacterium]